MLIRPTAVPDAPPRVYILPDVKNLEHPRRNGQAQLVGVTVIASAVCNAQEIVAYEDFIANQSLFRNLQFKWAMWRATRAAKSLGFE